MYDYATVTKQNQIISALNELNTSVNSSATLLNNAIICMCVLFAIYLVVRIVRECL